VTAAEKSPKASDAAAKEQSTHNRFSGRLIAAAEPLNRKIGPHRAKLD
jgi:hypothetical protein